MSTSPQLQRPLKRVPTAKNPLGNDQLMNNWLTVNTDTCLISLFVKARVHLNLIEILWSLKRDWKGEKRLRNTTRQLPDSTMAPQVFGQLFGVYLPIFNLKL